MIPTELRRAPSSAYLSGRSRDVLNAILFAWGREIDPDLLWISIRGSPADGSNLDPATLGWIPPERAFYADRPQDLQPDDAPANMALWSVIRSDEPNEVVARLSDFLRLPPMVQEIVSRASSAPRPRVLAAANTDRIYTLYPQTPAPMRRFVEAVTGDSFILLVGHAGLPGPNRTAFDFVFEVRTPVRGSWRDGTIYCEKGTAGGPLAEGREVRLADLPLLTAVLTDLDSSRDARSGAPD